MQLSELLKQINDHKEPPVESWNPDYCGEIDIVIKRNGDWYHDGGIISRKNMVKMFSSIIKREGDDYYLVTPVEKVRIRVEATPFVAVRSERLENQIIVTNNLDQQVVLNDEHPILLDSKEPQILWKRNIPARISTKLMYQWQVDALERGGLAEDGLYLHSGNQRYLIETISDEN
jgi:hypothetical protein